MGFLSQEYWSGLPFPSPVDHILSELCTWSHKELDTAELLNWTQLKWMELSGLLVFSTFFNFSLNLAIRSSWSKPQSAPDLVFTDYLQLLHLWLQRIQSVWFDIDHLVMSVYRVISCAVEKGCFLWLVHSLSRIQLAFSLCPALFYTPRLNLPVTPGISWLPTCAFQSPMMKRTSSFWY